MGSGDTAIIQTGMNTNVLMTGSADPAGQAASAAIPPDMAVQMQGLSAERRREILSQLETIRSDIKRTGALWDAGLNPIALLDDDQKKELLGMIAGPKDIADMNSRDSKTTAATTGLPDFFDWRSANGKNYITPVRDQGLCGSCWAFSAVAVLEGEVNAYYNNPSINLDLSEQDLVSCFNGPGCEGATSYQLAVLYSSYYHKYGVATESCFPYSATNNACANKCPAWQVDAWKIKGYQAVSLSVDSLKQALIAHGPIEVGMTVYNDFFAYTSGIYQHTTEETAGHHAVTIVGYGVYDGAVYWIVKNSWGTAWGENGYFRIFSGDSNIDNWFAFAVTSPASPTPNAVVCEDQDHDQYCYWGLGPRPANCPASCKAAIEDCDDANASLYAGCGLSDIPTGALNLLSNPSGAQVCVNDPDGDRCTYRGRTPLTITLNAGLRTLTVSMPGYIDEEVQANIISGAPSALLVHMRPAPYLLLPQDNDVFKTGETMALIGTVPSDKLIRYTVEYALSANPTVWNSEGVTLVHGGMSALTNSVLGSWDTSSISIGDYYDIKLKVYRTDHKDPEIVKHAVYLDPALKEGWPVHVGWDSYSGSPIWAGYLEPVLYDLNNDGRKEIIIAKQGNPDKIDVYAPDGTLMWERSVGPAAGGFGLTGPVVADLNNDGFGEVLIGYSSWNYAAGMGVCLLSVFDRSGNEMIAARIPPAIPPYISVADLNQDGKKEIIIRGVRTTSSKSPGSISVLNNKGIVLSSWTVQNQNFQDTIPSGPAVAGNLDDNPDLEIVSYWLNGNDTLVYAYKMNGTVLPGWPVALPGMAMSSPVIGDLNHDGKQEVLIGLESWSDPNSGGLYALDRNGRVLPGWPVLTGRGMFTSPALADLNQDGCLEVAVCDNQNGVWIFDKNGAVLPGWPQWVTYSSMFTLVFSDIDNDNIPELLCVGNNGFYPSIQYHGGVYAWKANGTLIPGFPKVTENGESYAAVADLDGDGKTEIVTTSTWDYNYVTYKSKSRSSIYVWDLDSILNPALQPWPTRLHDAQHSGLYSGDQAGMANP